MTQPKIDRRITRTKNDIKNALISLLEFEQDIKKISIIEIVEKANYNRTTFYAHYADKYEVVDEIMDDTINGFLQAYRAPYEKNMILDMTTILFKEVKIFDYIEEHDRLFTTLFTNPTFYRFPKKFVAAIEQVCTTEIIHLQSDFNEIDQKLYVRSAAYSIIGLIQLWVDQGFQYSSAYLTEQYLKIINFKPSEFKTITSDNDK